ncbi:hypothetical protein GCM10010211_56760 [Streptomyces albospinus]|uniref:Uncharacterized protein n=1 Tax=Streptomyces albospinus TaxID=285515 RepID=A0ABQ2VGW9_9ACTN|nr:hypothetical protein [Streptomyces albospinus]GGU83418.1 hypothetical protein GCM10010211_56760 [Streptomyces albospinus]
MSAVFAMPAAVRLPRTVAVRRALLAGLFLVGFLALGFAFGTGAHAADRVQTDGRSGPQALTGAPAPGGAGAGATTPDRAATRTGAAYRSSGLPSSEAALARQGAVADARFARRSDAAAGAVANAVRPAGRVAAPVTDRIARPVAGLAGAVKDFGGLGNVVGGALPVHLPFGELPGGPGDGGTPGQGGAPSGALPAGSGTVATGQAAGALHVIRPAHCADGPHQSAAQPRPVVHQQRDTGRNGLPGQFPQGPVAPAPHSAGDGHGPRGGDQHAAFPADSQRYRLLPGGVRTADGAPTRRRAEEILEFPG